MKRFLLSSLCLLTAALLIAVCVLSASAASFLRGDADGDGEISSVDATIVQRVISELRLDADGSIAKRGDVNGDGLDLVDATEIQRYLAGFENIYHIGDVCTDATEDPTSAFEFPTEDNQMPIIK